MKLNKLDVIDSDWPPRTMWARGRVRLGTLCTGQGHFALGGGSGSEFGQAPRTSPPGARHCVRECQAHLTWQPTRGGCTRRRVAWWAVHFRRFPVNLGQLMSLEGHFGLSGVLALSLPLLAGPARPELCHCLRGCQAHFSHQGRLHSAARILGGQSNLAPIQKCQGRPQLPQDPALHRRHRHEHRCGRGRRREDRGRDEGQRVRRQRRRGGVKTQEGRRYSVYMSRWGVWWGGRGLCTTFFTICKHAEACVMDDLKQKQGRSCVGWLVGRVRE
jgi:hypothetical protein